MARVLLTGATGFIGRHIYRVLLEGPHEVIPTCGRLVDLLDRSDSKLLLWKTKPNCLIANAWMAVPKIFWDHPSNEQWSEATMELIEEFYDRGGKRCIFVSSEAAVKHLDTPYGYYKKKVEDFLVGHPNHAVFRIGYPRGDGDALRFATQIAGLVQ